MSVRTVLTATHVAGPMWTIEGEPLIVAVGADPRALVTQRLVELATGEEPIQVTIRQGGHLLRLVLQDKALEMFPGDELTPASRAWVSPPAVESKPQDPSTAAAASYELMSAHAGSGASTWAELLDVAEVLPEGRTGAPVVLVVRSTIAGVEAAKPWTEQVSAVLMIADAPGKVAAPVARAIRVLAGAAPIVRVPWVPALRGVNAVPSGAALTKTAAKVAAEIERDRRK